MFHLSTALLSLSIKSILPPIGGRKSISRRKKGHFFAKKVPLFQKQSTGLFLKFTPEKSAALGDFAVCGRRPGLSALDLTSFLKKAGPKTFAFASRFQDCFLTDCPPLGRWGFVRDSGSCADEILDLCVLVACTDGGCVLKNDGGVKRIDRAVAVYVCHFLLGIA